MRRAAGGCGCAWRREVGWSSIGCWWITSLRFGPLAYLKSLTLFTLYLARARALSLSLSQYV